MWVAVLPSLDSIPQSLWPICSLGENRIGTRGDGRSTLQRSLLVFSLCCCSVFGLVHKASVCFVSKSSGRMLCGSRWSMCGSQHFQSSHLSFFLCLFFLFIVVFLPSSYWLWTLKIWLHYIIVAGFALEWARRLLIRINFSSGCDWFSGLFWGGVGDLRNALPDYIQIPSSLLALCAHCAWHDTLICVVEITSSWFALCLPSGDRLSATCMRSNQSRALFSHFTSHLCVFSLGWFSICYAHLWYDSFRFCIIPLSLVSCSRYATSVTATVCVCVCACVCEIENSDHPSWYLKEIARVTYVHLASGLLHTFDSLLCCCALVIRMDWLDQSCFSSTSLSSSCFPLDAPMFGPFKYAYVSHMPASILRGLHST